MDPRDNEKTREETLHRLLARNLRLGLGAGGADCPEADILAAYFDRSLSPAETSHWESHFSACDRCQQVLAAMATSALEPVTVGEPGRVAALAARPATQGPPPQPRTLRRYLSWNWLVPAVATAAAVALWLAVRPARKPTTQIARQTQATAPMPQMPLEAPKELAKKLPLPAPAPADRVATRATPPSRNAGSQAVHEQYARATPATRAEAAKTLSADAFAQREAAAAPATETRGFGVAAAPPRAAAEEKVEQERVAKKKEAIQVAAAPPRPGASVAESAVTQEGGKAAAGMLADAKPGPGAAGATQQAPRARALVRNRAADQAPQVIVATPARAVLWRVGPGGSIERSRDAGRTWQVQTSNVDADLLAGAAPSETVCWVVGSTGTILRTTNGVHWEKIASPATADWVGVQAQDALHARVTAAGGAIFVTEDGGQTWLVPAAR